MKSTPSTTVELYPYRALSRRGFTILMTCIVFVSFVAGIAFLLMGAWPVFGFFGLDVVLIWWAMKRNYKDARCREEITISRDEIIVRRFAANKPDSIERFVRPWARIHLEEDLARELIGKLFVTTREARAEVGSFLSPNDRKSLAAALQQIMSNPGV